MNDLASNPTSERFLNHKRLYRSMALCLHRNFLALLFCLSLIMVGDGTFLWLLCFYWPISIEQCLGEGTHSPWRLTWERRECYLLILGTEPLIRHKGGNSDRRTIFGNAATRILGFRPIRKLVHGPKQPVIMRSRNNSD